MHFRMGPFTEAVFAAKKFFSEDTVCKLRNSDNLWTDFHCDFSIFQVSNCYFILEPNNQDP